MVDFLGSLFCLYIVWILCKNSSLCDYSYLNRRIHITLHHKLLKRIFIHDFETRQAHSQMGIVGILAYIILFPTAFYIWITDGRFLLANITICPLWYELLFFSVVIFSTTDFWIGYFLVRRAKRK